MKQMSLSQMCKLYGFTRRVIQGYEKEGLIKHIGKNKYGHLLYDEKDVKKVAYIRYLQINGLSLKEISTYIQQEPYITLDVLKLCNKKHIKRIQSKLELINRNNEIMKLSKRKDKNTQNKIKELMMEEFNNEEII